MLALTGWGGFERPGLQVDAGTQAERGGGGEEEGRCPEDSDQDGSAHQGVCPCGPEALTAFGFGSASQEAVLPGQPPGVDAVSQQPEEGGQQREGDYQ
ncbi:hypothetical protein N566_22175 [Streptomycetaceae bacterium MP113-05]|nr:hypothetical protein N566_22175 [Streptomycetaceae bacterium MP113-05]